MPHPDFLGAKDDRPGIPRSPDFCKPGPISAPWIPGIRPTVSLPDLVVLELVRFIANHQIDPRVFHLQVVHDGLFRWDGVSVCKCPFSILKNQTGL